MSPREIIALAIGVLLGVVLQGGLGHGPSCACHGCERDRWKRGKKQLDPGPPPQRPHNMLPSDVPPIAKPNPEAHHHMERPLLGGEWPCCTAARREAAAQRGPC